MESKWVQTPEAVWEGSRSVIKECPKKDSKHDAQRMPLGSQFGAFLSCTFFRESVGLELLTKFILFLCPATFGVSMNYTSMSKR